MDKQTQPLSPALIKEVLAHKPQAAAELVQQLQTPVFNLALRMLGSVADAEDATQEILLLVLEKLPGFRGESALTTWVYRLAVNRLIDEKRSMFATHPLSFEAYAQDIQAFQKESQREDSGPGTEIVVHQRHASMPEAAGPLHLHPGHDV